MTPAVLSAVEPFLLSGTLDKNTWQQAQERAYGLLCGRYNEFSLQHHHPPHNVPQSCGTNTSHAL